MILLQSLARDLSASGGRINSFGQQQAPCLLAEERAIAGGNRGPGRAETDLHRFSLRRGQRFQNGH